MTVAELRATLMNFDDALEITVMGKEITGVDLDEDTICIEIEVEEDAASG